MSCVVWRTEEITFSADESEDDHLWLPVILLPRQIDGV
jgi:hypothetical protein